MAVCHVVELLRLGDSSMCKDDLPSRLGKDVEDNVLAYDINAGRLKQLAASAIRARVSDRVQVLWDAGARSQTLTRNSSTKVSQIDWLVCAMK
eukprot:1363948-Pleurochrysis_carterae.AAC.2